MPLLKLSCANCSAPLEVGDNMDRFTCSYCGTAQVVERSGGVISTRKLETAINAVQRGTDRTAAELAMPRLDRELAQAMVERAKLIEQSKKRIATARSSRLYVAIIAFFCAAILGLMVLMALSPKSVVLSTILSLAWFVGIFAAPILVFVKFKMPQDNADVVVHSIDDRIEAIEQRIAANRRILDAMPA